MHVIVLARWRGGRVSIGVRKLSSLGGRAAWQKKIRGSSVPVALSCRSNAAASRTRRASMRTPMTAPDGELMTVNRARLVAVADHEA